MLIYDSWSYDFLFRLFFSPNASAAGEKILLLKWLNYQKFLKRTINRNNNKKST